MIRMIPEEDTLMKNRKRVITIITAAAVICAVSGAAVWHQRVQAQAAQEEEKEAVTTVTVSSTDVEKTLSLTGTLVSASEDNANTSLTDVPVKEVRVKIGDTVNRGDVLYTLDTTELQRNLEAAEKSLSIAEAQNKLNKDDADRQLNDAQITGVLQATDAVRSVSNADSDLNKASSTLSDACSQVGSAKNDENAKNDQKNAAAAKLQSAQNAVDSAKAELKASTASDNSALNAKITELETAYSNAKADYDTASSAYDSAVSTRQAREDAVKSAKESVTSAQRAVDTANSAKAAASNTIANSLASQQKNVESTKLTAEGSTTDLQNSIEKYKTQLSHAVVSADIAGTVTAVNVRPGFTYSGTEGVTIDNMELYNVSTDADESNVADLAVGMTVNVKTDSTKDEILTGKIFFISPTPTKASSTGSTTANTSTAADTGKTDKSRGTYKTLISLDKQNSRLRLGMTAKLTVILDSAKNTLAVPVSAITTDVSGNATVQKTEDGGLTSQTVTLKTGLENDYYAAVTGGLKKGDTVIVPSDDSEDSTDSTDGGMGALGGIM